jgi:cytochrome b subunit of formate dehydrogenase
VISLITEWGETILRFVIVFNLVLAFLYAAMAAGGYPLDASGLPGYGWIQYLAKNFGGFSMSNDASGQYNVGYASAFVFLLTFLVSIATGIASTFAYLAQFLPPGVSWGVAAVGIFLQAVALAYLSYAAYRFFRSLFSPIVMA